MSYGWELWATCAALLAAGELRFRNWVFLWPALGAAAAAVGSALGLADARQVTLFSVISIVLLALSRTVFSRWFTRRGRRAPAE